MDPRRVRDLPEELLQHVFSDLTARERWETGLPATGRMTRAAVLETIDYPMLRRILFQRRLGAPGHVDAQYTSPSRLEGTVATQDGDLEFSLSLSPYELVVHLGIPLGFDNYPSESFVYGYVTHFGMAYVVYSYAHEVHFPPARFNGIHFYYQIDPRTWVSITLIGGGNIHIRISEDAVMTQLVPDKQVVYYITVPNLSGLGESAQVYADSIFIALQWAKAWVHTSHLDQVTKNELTRTLGNLPMHVYMNY